MMKIMMGGAPFMVVQIPMRNYNPDANINSYNVVETESPCVFPGPCGSCDAEDACSCSELTYVPDDSFEEYIENNIPGASNGTIGDNYVLTSGLNFLDNTGIMPPAIILSPESLSNPIFDLTGIENFHETYLIISNQMMSSIDLLVDFNSRESTWVRRSYRYQYLHNARKHNSFQKDNY